MLLLRTSHCAFASGCWLLLVHFAAGQLLEQKPRYIGFSTGQVVKIYCLVKEAKVNKTVVTWHRASVYSGKKDPLSPTERFNLNEFPPEHAWRSMNIKDVTPEDSGVYFCQADGIWGCGTEVKVIRRISAVDAMKKSQTKDVLIVLQAMLLVVFLLIPGVLFLRKVTQEDRIYEEPEDNHLYEGLQIEHCDLYEDITPYSQPSEAPWEGPESPCEE